MFVFADDDNAAALATYRSAGGREASRPVMLEWELTDATDREAPAPGPGRPAPR